MMYFNYGGDYVDRDYVLNGTTQVGYGNCSADMSGCGIEPASTCVEPDQRPNHPGNSTVARATTRTCRSSQPATGAISIAGPKGRLRQGIQYSLIRRDLWSGQRRRQLRTPAAELMATTT